MGQPAGGPGAALVDALAAAVGAAALVVFVALGLGVGDAARRMFPADARLVEVVPAQVSLGGLLGGGRLDEAALRRLAALPGVRPPGPGRTWWSRWPPPSRRAASRRPGRQGMTLQIPVVGIDPEHGGGRTRAAASPFADPADGGPIPVVLSRRLVEIYDKTIAPTWGIPGLPAGLDPVGLELPVRIGVSIIPGKSERRVLEVRVRLAGLSDRVPLYAMAVPLATVQRLHRLYNRSDPGYGQVTLLAGPPADAPGHRGGGAAHGLRRRPDRSRPRRSGWGRWWASPPARWPALALLMTGAGGAGHRPLARRQRGRPLPRDRPAAGARRHGARRPGHGAGRGPAAGRAAAGWWAWRWDGGSACSAISAWHELPPRLPLPPRGHPGLPGLAAGRQRGRGRGGRP